MKAPLSGGGVFGIVDRFLIQNEKTRMLDHRDCSTDAWWCVDWYAAAGGLEDDPEEPGEALGDQFNERVICGVDGLS